MDKIGGRGGDGGEGRRAKSNLGIRSKVLNRLRNAFGTPAETGLRGLECVWHRAEV